MVQMSGMPKPTTPTRGPSGLGVGMGKSPNANNSAVHSDFYSRTAA